MQERGRASRLASARQFAERLLGGADAFADDLAQPGVVRIAGERLQLLQVERKMIDEIGELVDDDRRRHHQQRADPTMKSDDHQRREQPVHAHALEPGGQRIEQIGDHHAGHERQQNFAQQHDRRDDRRQHRDPERDGSCQVHLLRLCRPSASGRTA